jgi:hypothetical protein
MGIKMSLQSVKISEASPLSKVELEKPILVPVSDGTNTPRSLSLSTYSESLLEQVGKLPGLVKVEDLENYYTKTEVDDLISHTDVGELTKRVDKLEGPIDEPGSIAYQINMATIDLIGPIGDSSDHDTINAAKTLVAESLQFIKYEN